MKQPFEIKNLPHQPGVYQYFDKNGKIIYVGKAKNIKKRVAGYFKKDKQINGKTILLVRRIASLEYIVTNTELEALLLENSLIKKYQPKYNIQLKDDKTYPWICIKKESFPRVFSTRKVIKDGSEYFGPYASVKMVNILLGLIKKLYLLRTCNLKLSSENINNGKFKVCLEYHIGNCLGPCVGKQSIADYDKNIEQIRLILKGNISIVIKTLKDNMWHFADSQNFEEAHEIKEKLKVLEKYQGRSVVVNSSIKDLDVFSFAEDTYYGYVNYLKVVDGAIIKSHTVEIKKKLDENPEEILIHAIIDILKRLHSKAKEIIVPFKVQISFPDVQITSPKIGDKKKLLFLSERNLKYYIKEKHQQLKNIDPEKYINRILSQLKSDLRLKDLPEHIECFDNSNIQGTNAVAAMVCFKGAKPSKKDYRHYNIKTVEGPDDYASMEEVIFRRYKRLVDEKAGLPQLIVIDGGKGQLNAAIKSLKKTGLDGKIAIIGIAKRLEEIYFPGDSLPLYIDKKSESLKLIQYMRNEAHRFGITHHRNKRSKESFRSELLDIPGIGEKMMVALLKEFKSVEKIKNTPISKLEPLVGKAKAKALKAYFKK